MCNKTGINHIYLSIHINRTTEARLHKPTFSSEYLKGLELEFFVLITDICSAKYVLMIELHLVLNRTSILFN